MSPTLNFLIFPKEDSAMNYSYTYREQFLLDAALEKQLAYYSAYELATKYGWIAREPACPVSL